MEENEITQSTENAGVMDSEFIPLDALVYAPLHALAESNRQLRAQIVEAIKGMGTQRYNGSEEITHLDNINIAYDQIRQEGEDGYSVDNLQVQVPLLSIIPVANLNVDKAEICFSTEVKAEMDQETKNPQITARICAPSQRESDFLPKVSYKLSIVSIPATEGIMRLSDTLSANQVAKRIDSTPIVLNGDLGNEEQKAIVQETKQLRAKVSKLEQLHRKITGMIEEQERLHQISKDAFDGDTHEFDKDKYLMAQSTIVNRIMECKEQIVDREILYGLERDFK
ncbi:DUF2589 domain-containing protein [Lachnospiraceae bacterium MD335]|jgi:polyhydroxyalkanoate synthesis regulator phasin|nr:DUF2589 domain-containing protein [Lachnospiraceae bacterium MD335]